ncbi:hypothetical protein OsI_22130 [Oryza sativa Indica Group]|uniref:DUF3475 domain-containing protein n=1 Tax=Oryza sativa subsp. indica TaxID=39946 RepID=A2YAL5_ORYSI|nr:hypothetical protein OsI_22130 [Oryza sativa Indica Group]
MATSTSRKVKPVTSSGNGGAAAAAAEGVDDGKVDILSFEVANAMSRAANLYPLAVGRRGGAAAHPRCLGSQAVRALVPGDDSWLLALTLAEKLDTLNRVAAVATRLGRRCMLQALLEFDGSTTSTPTSLLAAPTPP